MYQWHKGSRKVDVLVLYLSRFWCHCRFAVYKWLPSVLDDTIWEIVVREFGIKIDSFLKYNTWFKKNPTVIRESGMMSSLFFLPLWSWFHWWVRFVRLPASSEVLSSAAAASLHVSYRYNLLWTSPPLISLFFYVIAKGKYPLQGILQYCSTATAQQRCRAECGSLLGPVCSRTMQWKQHHFCFWKVWKH